jgi:hypothetical protein
MPLDARLTTPIILICTIILVSLDAILIFMAWRTIRREQFEHMRWLLVIAGGIFFLLVWTSVMLWAWDWFYSYIFPAWGRYLLPPIFWIWYTLIALVMVWLSLKMPGNPAVTWCILGGVEGLLSHLYAIFGLGAASKPPIMQGTDPFAVLIFAVFEKAFYWSLILLACGFIWRIMKRRTGPARWFAIQNPIHFHPFTS